MKPNQPATGLPRHWFPLLIATLMAALLSTGPAQAQANKFEQLGCYKNAADKRIWVAGLSISDPNLQTLEFYENPDNGFAAIMKAGDTKFDVSGDDILVHPLSAFDFAGADKYQFLRYSLVLDYSSSIADHVRTDVINFVSSFINKMPLAVDGNLVRFSSNVEVGPYSSKKIDLEAAIRAPISYDLTALHDALMASVTSLTQNSSNTPVRVLILVTDGMDTASTQYTDRQAFISSFTSLAMQEKIIVLAIGVTPERDDELLNAITDRSKGIMGIYKPIADFNELNSALDLVLTQIRNTVIFRFPMRGPDKGNVDISVGTKSMTGKFNTIHTFKCQF
jgi:hypothetical protein